MSADGGGVAALRLDKFLWFARLARTRSAAARLCAEGCVAIAGVTAFKPHQPVRVGDWITVEQGRWRRRLCVTALGERRGGATDARRFYDEPDPPQPNAREPWIALLGAEVGA